MRERDIEAELVRRVEALGGLALKFTSPARRNVPDRVVQLPNGAGAVFVELKAPGQRPTAGQLREHERIRRAGGLVYVIDSLQALDDFMRVVDPKNWTREDWSEH